MTWIRARRGAATRWTNSGEQALSYGVDGQVAEGRSRAKRSACWKHSARRHVKGAEVAANNSGPAVCSHRPPQGHLSPMHLHRAHDSSDAGHRSRAPPAATEQPAMTVHGTDSWNTDVILLLWPLGQKNSNCNGLHRDGHCSWSWTVFPLISASSIARMLCSGDCFGDAPLRARGSWCQWAPTLCLS